MRKAGSVPESTLEPSQTGDVEVSRKLSQLDMLAMKFRSQSTAQSTNVRRCFRLTV
ncbi:hypothetical protein AAVH_25182, partial [Aphelenchoides avenae]